MLHEVYKYIIRLGKYKHQNICNVLFNVDLDDTGTLYGI